MVRKLSIVHLEVVDNFESIAGMSFLQKESWNTCLSLKM